MAKYSHAYGGVGAPVGLTVFKTAGGSLGAIPGGFDSHTPLPRTFAIVCNFQRNCEMKWNSNITPKKFNVKITKSAYKYVLRFPALARKRNTFQRLLGKSPRGRGTL